MLRLLFGRVFDDTLMSPISLFLAYLTVLLASAGALRRCTCTNTHAGARAHTHLRSLIHTICWAESNQYLEANDCLRWSARGTLIVHKIMGPFFWLGIQLTRSVHIMHWHATSNWHNYWFIWKCYLHSSSESFVFTWIISMRTPNERQLEVRCWWHCKRLERNFW